MRNNKKFTDQEIEELESLAVVEHATTSRITYSHAFQVYCMYQYVHGTRPSVIFSNAGLDRAEAHRTVHQQVEEQPPAHGRGPTAR